MLHRTTLTHTQRSNAEVEEDERASQSQPPPWPDLLPELLELIASTGLTAYHKIRASRVCKAWHSAMRVVNRFPWVFYYPKQGSDPDTCKLFDPTMSTTYSIDAPELRGATLCYAKDGWLLLYRRRTGGVFFFHPFTRDSIELPGFKRLTERFAFSCAPTSPGCVVFIATRNFGCSSSIGIHTCHPGDTQWTTSIHCGRFHFVPGGEHKLVVCNGLFYCLCFSQGHVGVFEPQGRKWSVFMATPLTCWREEEGKVCSTKGTFVAEYRGEIVGVHTCLGETPILFKLHQTGDKVEWNEVSNLDGASFFAGFVASHAKSRVDLPPGGIIKTRIYLPMDYFARMQNGFITYSIDDDECQKREMWDENWEKSHLLNSLWIEPPQDLPSSFSCRLVDQSKNNTGDHKFISS